MAHHQGELRRRTVPDPLPSLTRQEKAQLDQAVAKIAQGYSAFATVRVTPLPKKWMDSLGEIQPRFIGVDHLPGHSLERHHQWGE